MSTKTKKKAFRLILSNSKTHSEEACATRIMLAINTSPRDTPCFSPEARTLAAKVHVHGSATIITGTRKVCRIAAKKIKEAGGDEDARRILGSRPVWDTLDWDAPMKTTIVR